MKGMNYLLFRIAIAGIILLLWGSPLAAGDAEGNIVNSDQDKLTTTYRLARVQEETNPEKALVMYRKLQQAASVADYAELKMAAFDHRIHLIERLYGNKAVADTIKQLVNTTPDTDREWKVMLLCSLSEYYFRNNIQDKANLFLKAAEKISAEHKGLSLYVQLINADLLWSSGDEEQGTRIFDDIPVASLNELWILPYTYNNVASHHELAKGNPKAAGSYMLKAIASLPLLTESPTMTREQANLTEKLLSTGDTAYALDLMGARLKLLSAGIGDEPPSEGTAHISTDHSLKVSWIWLAVIALLFIASILYLLKLYINKLTLEKKLRDTKQRIINQEQVKAAEERDQHVVLDINVIREEIENKQKVIIKLEESLAQGQEADHLKNVFLSKLSHEVRNPLTAILGFSSILQEQLAYMENSELYEYASAITKSGDGLLDLLNNIFDLSLINSNNLELNINNFNLYQVIEQIVKGYENTASQKNIRILISGNNPFPIDSDTSIIKRVVEMIVDNAVRFTEQGYVHIKLNSAEDISIQVIDSGIGIDSHYLDDIFEPYKKEKLGYSTNLQGAGLGLPLSRKMVEILGGAISIESEKGNGTTVTVTLPKAIDHGGHKLDEKPTEDQSDLAGNTDKSQADEDTRPLLVYYGNDMVDKLLIRKYFENQCHVKLPDTTDDIHGYLRENQVHLIYIDLESVKSAQIRQIQEYIKQYQGKEPVAGLVGITSDAFFEADKKGEIRMDMIITRPLQGNNLMDAYNRFQRH